MRKATHDSNRKEPSAIEQIGIWAVLAFAFNLAWEVAHVRLYALWVESDGSQIARSILHCSSGDVAIALTAYALAGFALARADWLRTRPWAGCAIVVVASITFTAFSEWYNVYRVGAWSYGSAMPTIFGLGLSPLMQWLVIPPALVASSRFLLAFIAARKS